MKELDARLFWERLRIQQIKAGVKSLKLLCEREGMSYQTLINQKHANRFPAVSVIITLASALNCSIDWLLTGKENVYPYAENIQKAIDILLNID